MVSDSLAMLIFIGLDLPLGSRASTFIGDEILQHGDKFHLSIHLSVHPSICPSSWLHLRPGWLALRSCWLALRPSQLAMRPSLGGMDIWTLPCFPPRKLRKLMVQLNLASNVNPPITEAILLYIRNNRNPSLTDKKSVRAGIYCVVLYVCYVIV